MGLKRMLNVARDDAGFASEEGVSRRTFLKVSAAAGGGLLIGFYLPAVRAAPATAANAGDFAPNAFVLIGRDDSVTLIMPQVEMGQGTYTSMPMLIAEELEVDLGQIELEAAPPDDRRYANSLIGFQVTGGSSSVRAMWEPLRRAGAVARVMLISAAAQGWNVDPTSCRAEKGEVIHGPTGRKLRYGALADTAAALHSATGIIRSEVGRQLGLRHTPSLEFVADVLPDTAQRIEELVTQARSADAELARSREGAKHAGDPDPYRKPADDSDEDDNDS